MYGFGKARPFVAFWRWAGGFGGLRGQMDDFVFTWGPRGSGQRLWGRRRGYGGYRTGWNGVRRKESLGADFGGLPDRPV